MTVVNGQLCNTDVFVGRAPTHGVYSQTGWQAKGSNGSALSQHWDFDSAVTMAAKLELTGERRVHDLSPLASPYRNFDCEDRSRSCMSLNGQAVRLHAASRRPVLCTGQDAGISPEELFVAERIRDLSQ